MTKEELPIDKRFVIRGRQQEYKDIASGLQEQDKEGFFQAMGLPQFRDDKRAINVYGEEVLGCSDEERLEAEMKKQGYSERIDVNEARRKTKVIYQRPSRHQRKFKGHK